MNVNPMANAKTPDFRNAHAALLRAAEAAHARAKQFDTLLAKQQNARTVQQAVN